MKTDMLTPETLASMIDHTLLKQFITLDKLKTHCQEAVAYGFKAVAINGAVVSFCKELLNGSPVLCDATVGFPLGQSTIEAKVFEAEDAIKKGAGEIDYVVNLVELKSGHWDYIQEEMKQITDACRKQDVGIKVIFENCFLSDDEKRRLCEISLNVKPDYIKTSTGFGTGGATLDDIRLMKEYAGNEIKVKASGGIRTAEKALAMIQAGATRIGTSAGTLIVDEYRRMIG